MSSHIDRVTPRVKDGHGYINSAEMVTLLMWGRLNVLLKFRCMYYVLKMHNGLITGD